MKFTELHLKNKFAIDYIGILNCISKRNCEWWEGANISISNRRLTNSFGTHKGKYPQTLSTPLNLTFGTISTVGFEKPFRKFQLEDKQLSS